MSEERMIRIHKGEQKLIYVDLLDWDKLELAPSKDFKPKCYYETLPIIVGNAGGRKIMSGIKPKCVSCDIREHCIYKRE